MQGRVDWHNAQLLDCSCNCCLACKTHFLRPDISTWRDFITLPDIQCMYMFLCCVKSLS